MLVYMQHSGSVQLACKAIVAPMVCGVCKRVVDRGQYYTKHQAPDPRRLDPKTGSYRMVPYNACEACAPFTRLEQTTGELTLPELLNRAKMESEETVAQIPVVRTSTPRPDSSIQRRISSILRPNRLTPMRDRS